MSVILVQRENTPYPIEVTELGISIEARLVQFAKASSPIEITELGISAEVKFVQL